MKRNIPMIEREVERRFEGDHTLSLRWKDGFVCPKCQHGEYYYIQTRKLFEWADE